MPLLFRTAYPPTTYKSPVFSVASFFKLICTLFKYLVPIIICVFYFFHESQISVDTETPILIPGSVEYFGLIAVDDAGTNYETIQYPSTTAAGISPSFSTIRTINNSGFLTSATYRITIPNMANGIIGFRCIFSYNVTLRGFVNSSTKAYGLYTETFSTPLKTLKCDGDIALYQTQPVDFRGNLPNDVIPEMASINIKNLIEAESAVSSKYYIKWNQYSGDGKFDSNTFTFEANLKINPRPINVIHTLPLVSIIESIVILYLSTYILCTLIVNGLQHIVFYNGIIKTFRDQYYTPENNKAIAR